METHEQIGEYVVDRVIGSGSTGKVKLAHSTRTMETVAIKVIKKSKFESKPEIKEKIQREIAIMRVFKHSRLLKLIEICESANHIYLVLEYAENGELFDYIVKKKALSEYEAMRFFRQIIYGLDYLHTHSVCHRDLKPENILLDSSNNIKIADFGLARLMSSNTLDTYCGSVHYAAPEIVTATPYSGYPVDIWSCGVVLFTLLTGKLPFHDVAFRKTVEKIKVGHFVIPENISSEIRELIASMLQVDPNLRLTCRQIKEHPAFRIGLPPEYILPCPFPLVSLNDSLDLDTIDQNVIDTLKQLGFSSVDEINTQLSTPGSSLVKVFYSMLMRQSDLDALPWPDEGHSGANFSHSPQIFNNNISDTLGHHVMTPMSNMSFSPMHYSLAERAHWGNIEDGSYPCEIEQPIMDINLSLEVVISRMQMLLNEMGFVWLYPDDVTLISKDRESASVVVFTITYQPDGLLTMTITCGDDNQVLVQNITDRITQILQG